MAKVIELTGNRRPSKAQVASVVRPHFVKASEDLDVVWGENTLEFKLMFGKWCGFGWIGKISGQDLADELTKALSA